MALVDLLMKKLQMQNPQAYKFVSEVKHSGCDPNVVLREMYQKGQINDQQLSTIQRQGRMFGVNITNQDLAKIKAIDSKPPQKTKFGGWF